VKLNTIIRLPDGREGTIAYHFLDGYGGVWGRQAFDKSLERITDELPAPDFMLRPKELEGSLRRSGHKPEMECVGEEYEVVEQPEAKEDRP
jgi:hypothetical protein